MLVRAYLLTWGILLVAALAFLATGNFSMFTGVVFGFLAFGMTFMGMMSVLPSMVAHPEPPKPIVREPAKETAGVFGVLKSA